MYANNFSLSAYLARIGFSASATPDVATLRALMRCQLFTVPFENLDVQAGKRISLVPEDIVEKIVHRRRGGYCYEVNGIFAMALQALGIPYVFLAARPMFYPVRRPKTHMAILASVDGDAWLCDLGFGSYGIREPIRLDWLDREITQDRDVFRLSKTSEHLYLLQAWVDGAWSNQYEFDCWPHEWIDFAPANYLNCTHPEAVFVQKILVVQHHAKGRSILFGNMLKTVEDGRINQVAVEPDHIPALLRDKFGLAAG